MKQQPHALALLHATANPPGGGAIAILQLHGDSRDVLHQLTGVGDWPIGRMRLVNFADIDEGLAVRLNDSVTQLMPHGGQRVVQRLTAKLIQLGASIVHDLDQSNLAARDIYPEAADEIEALMLQTLARAQSPLAIDLLLDQPRRWRDFKARDKELTQADHERSARLNRLITPPLVVLAGRPNVGKSTLSNALLGRSMSIALDMPGTTRDYIAARIELAGLVVDWHDTPGIRQSDDIIEQRAIELARSLIQRADLLLAITDPQTDWPDLPPPRPPHISVLNKVDLVARESEASHRAIQRASNTAPTARIINISAKTGDGIADLVTAARDALISPADLTHPGPWVFDQRLSTI